MGTLGDEPSDDRTSWGPLAVAALAYVAVGAWDWTDTVEALARCDRRTLAAACVRAVTMDRVGGSLAFTLSWLCLACVLGAFCLHRVPSRPSRVTLLGPI